MFNLSGTEVVFLLVAGLVVLGPERLPGVIRSVSRLYGDFRRAAQGVERELRETLGEPLGEITSTAKGLAHDLDRTRQIFGVVDPEPSPPMRPERSAAPEPHRPIESGSEVPTERSDDSIPGGGSDPS